MVEHAANLDLPLSEKEDLVRFPLSSDSFGLKID
jgi:hypothetical protein